MSKTDENMDILKKDVFREIANIGAGHASNALSMLLECPVKQNIPEVQLVHLEDMTELLGGPERIVVGVGMHISGSIRGYLLAILDFPQAENIIEMVRNQPLEKAPEGLPFSPIDESALKESVNIIGGSYLTAISQMTGLEIIPTTPFATMDMLGAILNLALVQAGQESDTVMYFKSGLFSSEAGFAGDLLLIPDQQSYQILLQSLGCL